MKQVRTNIDQRCDSFFSPLPLGLRTAHFSLLPLAGEGARRADEGGTAEDVFVSPTATLTRRAVRADLSRQRERRQAKSRLLPFSRQREKGRAMHKFATNLD